MTPEEVKTAIELRHPNCFWTITKDSIEGNQFYKIVISTETRTIVQTAPTLEEAVRQALI